MNEESLKRVNAFLAAISARVQVGEVVTVTPAEIGREVDLPEPLAAARAIRALLARRRLEVADGGYRLIDARPIDPGERESIARQPRKRRKARSGSSAAPPAASGRPTYSEVGREVVERLIELGREAGTLRAHLRTAREESRDAREAKDEAERRTSVLTERVRELEGRLEMAESNLRTMLIAAKGSSRDTTMGDAEMEAILGVLKENDARQSAEPVVEQAAVGLEHEPAQQQS
ncbi:MAG: hypothetical protein ACJ758_00870 [Actinomycetota bacterium]